MKTALHSTEDAVADGKEASFTQKGAVFPTKEAAPPPRAAHGLMITRSVWNVKALE